MNRAIRLTSLGFALSGLILAATVQAVIPPPNLAGTKQFAYCMSGYLAYTDPNAYFSPVFEIHVPQNAKLSYPEDLAKTYEGYLHQKYGYVPKGPMSVSCSFSVAAAAVDGGKDMVIKDTLYHQRKAVETGWKPSAQEILAAASATAAPAASQPQPQPDSAATYYGYCKGDQSSTKIYYSAIFSTSISPPPSQQSAEETRPTAERLARSFSAFLAGHYGFNGSAECNLGPTRSNLEWTWGRLKGLALNARDRFIETGWTPGS